MIVVQTAGWFLPWLIFHFSDYDIPQSWGVGIARLIVQNLQANISLLWDWSFHRHADWLFSALTYRWSLFTTCRLVFHFSETDHSTDLRGWPCIALRMIILNLQADLPLVRLIIPQTCIADHSQPACWSSTCETYRSTDLRGWSCSALRLIILNQLDDLPLVRLTIPQTCGVGLVLL